MIDLCDEQFLNEIRLLENERTLLLGSLDKTHDGLSWCAEHTAIVDRGIELIFRKLNEAIPKAPNLSIIATGGYGRKEMAPFSDIDLTVVPADDDAPYIDETLKSLFRALHTAMGGILKYEIGYSFRQISDIPGLDATTRTGLLDARLVAGSQSTFLSLMDRFWEELPSGEFVLAKISEHEAAMKRTNESPLVVEPHLKEGAGGLRSFQTANWVRSAIGERAVRPSLAYNKLLSVRNLLHAVSKRKQDLLTFPRLMEISEKFKADSDLLMTDVSNSLLQGYDAYQDIREKLLESRFSLSKSVISLRGEARIVSPADPGDVATGITIATSLGLKVSTVRPFFLSTVDGASAMHAVGQGEETIRNLDRCGALEVLLPELTDCRTLMPGDASHTFSVFEHTLQVIRNLDRVQSNSFLAEMMGSLGQPSTLYLAALLHDVGKLPSKYSGMSHSEEGFRLAKNVCDRWHLDDNISETIAWLVKEHLTLSLFLRIRDIDQPETIREFADIVGSTERLYLLALLTWADISAVSQNAFTASQDAFLKQLVYLVSERLSGNQQESVPIDAARRSLIRRLSDKSVSEDQLEEFLNTLPAQYLTGTDSSTMKRHFEFVNLAHSGNPIVDFRQRTDLAATEITVCAKDRPGLLAQILSVFYAFDVSIGGIRASTTQTTDPIVIDVFTVYFQGRMVPNGTIRQITSAMNQVLLQTIDADSILRSKGKDPDRRQKVLQYRILDGATTILEIQAPRGRGMPFRLTRLLAENGLNIISARVGQWGGSAAAAFYLQSSKSNEQIHSIIDSAFADVNA